MAATGCRPCARAAAPPTSPLSSGCRPSLAPRVNLTTGRRRVASCDSLSAGCRWVMPGCGHGRTSMARPGLGSVGRKGHSGAGHETALRASLPGRLRPGRCGADGAPARPRGVAVVAAPRRRGRQFGGGAAWREVGKPSA